jgi:DNA modification methylase
MTPVSRHTDYTFRHNQRLGRHGWLRLTPAYSVKLVESIIGRIPRESHVLDPFSGTATTGVAAAEHGVSSTLFDINPFLVWFGNAKLKTLNKEEISSALESLATIVQKVRQNGFEASWTPPLKNINRWWSRETLDALTRLRQTLSQTVGSPQESGCNACLWIAFARIAIDHSAAAFNHVSVSFKKEAPVYAFEEILTNYENFSRDILTEAGVPLSGEGKVILHDSTESYSIPSAFDAVVTSPPYPNRISYVRELRPYMYWLGFLTEAREAGELDWTAVGGTWGIATSRLQEWAPSHEIRMPSLHGVVEKIKSSNGQYGEILSRYVQKYFYDMDRHIAAIKHALKCGGEIHYIIGNSVFYGVHVPTAELYEESLRNHGFSNVATQIIRKRNCNKSLFEYKTSARNGGKESGQAHSGLCRGEPCGASSATNNARMPGAVCGRRPKGNREIRVKKIK